MKFSEIVADASTLLQRKGRITYRALQREFALDDEALEDLKNELIDAEQVARDENGKVLVWAGAAPVLSSEFRVLSLKDEGRNRENSNGPGPSQDSALRTQHSAAERRQLTVMFCDLVGSTVLSTQLDPEDYHTVVQRYHQTCEAVIQRYGGFVPQHLGDGLLVYFGYPTAHEDDAQRAVRTALGIIDAVQALSFSTIRLPRPVQVRIGIHTGLVVIGEIGSSEKREMLALGETPNLAARVQGIAEPNTVAMSAMTQRLVQGLFEYQELGPQELKGFAASVTVFRVVRESAAQNRFDGLVSAGLTPLVGREEELGVLRQRWTQAKQGAGQVVLLNGEPGIGKSRLVQELKEQVSVDGAIRIEFHCSPYHQNSALYPIIDHVQRLLQFSREDAPAVKLEKLQHQLSRYRFPQAETFPLFAALLSLPHPDGHPPVVGSPQKQKEKTQACSCSHKSNSPFLTGFLRQPSRCFRSNSFTRSCSSAECRASRIKAEREVPNFFTTLSTVAIKPSSNIICTVLIEPPVSRHQNSIARRVRKSRLSVSRTASGDDIDSYGGQGLCGLSTALKPKSILGI